MKVELKDGEMEITAETTFERQVLDDFSEEEDSSDMDYRYVHELDVDIDRITIKKERKERESA